MWIRSADHEDLEDIRDLLERTWHATYDAVYGADKVRSINESWHSLEALRKRLNKPYSEFVIADDGEDILGMAYASLTDERHRARSAAGATTSPAATCTFTFNAATASYSAAHPAQLAR